MLKSIRLEHNFQHRVKINLMGPHLARWTPPPDFIKNRGLVTTDSLNIPLSSFLSSSLQNSLMACIVIITFLSCNFNILLIFFVYLLCARPWRYSDESEWGRELRFIKHLLCARCFSIHHRIKSLPPPCKINSIRTI